MFPELPLPTLLSQVLVAFTIEFDNEFEHQMPHRTTSAPAAGLRRGPWLVSLVMWSNLMRFVGAQPIRAAELADQGGNLAGMERWGYIAVAPDPHDPRPKPPRRDWLVSATPSGHKAQEVWRPLFAVIEHRWETRFGAEQIARLRHSLLALVRQLDPALPEYLPVLGYGLWARGARGDRPFAARADLGEPDALPLSALLARPLLAFALEFERGAEVSLAISANVIRLLAERPMRVRDLPRRSGVSKAAVDIAVNFLVSRRLVTVVPDPTASRTQLVALTARGRQAHDAYRESLDLTQAHWRQRFGGTAIDAVYDSLNALGDESTGQPARLLVGLKPYSDGWRASIRPPETLPHHPMVLHRGGFPDGS